MQRFETFSKKVVDMLQAADHVPGGVDYKDSADGVTISLHVVLCSCGKAVGKVEIEAKAETEAETFETFLSTVELLCGLSPDDRHGLNPPEPSPPYVHESVEEDDPEAFEITEGERSLLLAFRSGRIIDEVETRVLENVARLVDPGGDFAYCLLGNDVERLRDLAARAGLPSSDASALVVMFADSYRRAVWSQLFIENVFKLFSAGGRLDNPSDPDPVLACVVGPPIGSTLFVAGLLSGLYSEKFKDQ